MPPLTGNDGTPSGFFPMHPLVFGVTRDQQGRSVQGAMASSARARCPLASQDLRSSIATERREFMVQVRRLVLQVV